jgi:hypothetical protein
MGAVSGPDAAALAQFLELRRLADLRDAGWTFTPRLDDDGQLDWLTGLRTWPEGQADALRIKSPTDAAGIRCDHAGGVLWELEGTLAEVVDGLLALPVPGDRLAPRLVRGRPQGGLWLP